MRDRIAGTLFLLLVLVAFPSRLGPPPVALARGDVLADAACPPLPPPAGTIVSVSGVAQLEDAVNAATSGTTILVADGTYNLNGVYLRFAVPNVTLRSASGNREAVVLGWILRGLWRDRLLARRTDRRRAIPHPRRLLYRRDRCTPGPRLDHPRQRYRGVLVLEWPFRTRHPPVAGLP